MIPLPNWLYILLQVLNAIVEAHRWIVRHRDIIGAWTVFIAILSWWVWFFGWHIQRPPE